MKQMIIAAIGLLLCAGGLQAQESPNRTDTVAAGTARVSRVCAVPAVPDEELMDAILAPYRGRAVLVDFWATWCNPCRMANHLMKPMKESLGREDIVFVYITGETSPLETWESMIPDIPGDHYRLSNDQWAYLGETLGIRGVPAYHVIDRQGRTTYQQVGFPGTERIKEELLKALE